MKPNDLIGEVFTIPVFSATSQKYKLKDAIEIWPGRWEFRLDYLPSSFSVPEEIKIEVDKMDNFKKLFTLSEYNNKTKLVHSLNKKIIKDSECNSMTGLKKVFFTLGEF